MVKFRCQTSKPAASSAPPLPRDRPAGREVQIGLGYILARVKAGMRRGDRTPLQCIPQVFQLASTLPITVSSLCWTAMAREVHERWNSIKPRDLTASRCTRHICFFEGTTASTNVALATEGGTEGGTEGETLPLQTAIRKQLSLALSQPVLAIAPAPHLTILINLSPD